MKYFLVLVLGLAVLTGCSSGSVKKAAKTQEVQLVKNIAPGYFKPHWMPDGKKLLVTGVQDKGLHLFDLSSEKMTSLCTDKGAGRNVAVSGDGRHIAYSAFNLIKRRRANTIHLLDGEGHNKAIFSDRTPCKIIGWNAGKLLYLVDNTLHAYDPATGTDTAEPKDIAVGYTDMDLHLVWYDHGQTSVLDPLGKGNYIWAETSPDGKHLVFNFAGSGTRICDAKGKIVASLQRLHAAHWTKDGQWLIGMDERDDGLKFTSSDIYKVSKDGKTRINLTEKTPVIALYPRLSPDEKQVVFHSPEGWLYTLQVQ